MDDCEWEERTFTLRLWRERPPTAERPAVWRFALTGAHSRQRRGFGAQEALVAFLRAELGQKKAVGKEEGA